MTEISLGNAEILVVPVFVAGDFSFIVPVQGIDILIELKAELNLIATVFKKHRNIVARSAREAADDEPAELPSEVGVALFDAIGFRIAIVQARVNNLVIVVLVVLGTVAA